MICLSTGRSLPQNGEGKNFGNSGTKPDDGEV
jgi:hypothetical protein